jgi:hypothetical protein
MVNVNNTLDATGRGRYGARSLDRGEIVHEMVGAAPFVKSIS